MTQQPSRSGQDLIGDFQRWLVRSGARSVSREVGGQIRSVLGRGSNSVDVWEAATTPPTDEAPECAWCPVCRAARVLREQGPGMSSQVTAATEAMGTLARDALSVFEAALAATGKAAKQGTESEQGTGSDQRTDGKQGTRSEQAPSASVWADVTEQDAAREPGMADLADESGPVDLAEEPGMADLADESGPVDLAEEPGTADLADEPEPTGSPAEPPHEPDDRG